LQWEVGLQFEERRVASNITELVLAERPVFRAYEVYVMSVNDVGPAVTVARPVIAFTGEDGP